MAATCEEGVLELVSTVTVTNAMLPAVSKNEICSEFVFVPDPSLQHKYVLERRICSEAAAFRRARGEPQVRERHALS